MKALVLEKENLLESVFACLTRISLKTKSQDIDIIFEPIRNLMCLYLL